MHTVKIVLHNLIIVSGFFTLEELNGRLNNFDYGFDVGGKPSVFTEERLIVFFYLMLGNFFLRMFDIF